MRDLYLHIEIRDGNDSMGNDPVFVSCHSVDLLVHGNGELAEFIMYLTNDALDRRCEAYR